MVFCYKYIWKKVDGKMCLKFIVGPELEHENFKKMLIENEEIDLALCEYQYEIDFSKINQNDKIKGKENEEFIQEEKA